ncbi:MAG: MFS transporter [Pseudomonadota bacterium]
MKNLFPLAFATFVFILPLGMLVPLLPFMVLDYEGSSFWAAGIFAVFSGASLIAAPFWGRMADRFGRKPTMAICALITCLSYYWIGIADSAAEIIFSRMLAGLGAGWLTCAQAYVADTLPEDKRAHGMGLLGASFGAGFTIGPGIGAYIASFPTEFARANYGDAVDLSAVITLLAFIVLLLLVREPENRTIREQHFSLRGFGIVWRDPQLRIIMAIYGLSALVFTSIEGSFALWAHINFQATPSQVGYWLVFGGIVTIIVQGGLVGRCKAHFGERTMVITAIICFMLALLALIIIDTPPILALIPLGLMALALGLHNPIMQGVISRLAPPRKRGGIMGLAGSCHSLARVIGPTVAGLMMAHTTILLTYGLVMIVALGALGLLLKQNILHQRPNR